jgi:hypothetical protein
LTSGNTPVNINIEGRVVPETSPRCGFFIASQAIRVELMAAPLGNQNGAKAKIWSDAIARALKIEDPRKKRLRLDLLAEALIDKALTGDVGALKEIGDRIEGKPIQPITGEGGGPLIVELVKFADTLTR